MVTVASPHCLFGVDAGVPPFARGIEGQGLASKCRVLFRNVGFRVPLTDCVFHG